MEQQNNNIPHIQLVAQWITSLAISVVCCAVLFIVFAGYIVNMNNDMNLLTVRIEVLRERESTMLSDINAIKKTLAIQAAVPAPSEATPAAAAAPEQLIPSSVELPEAAPSDPSVQQGLAAPVMVPSMEEPETERPVQESAPAAQ